jgi:hypothetical protein
VNTGADDRRAGPNKIARLMRFSRRACRIAAAVILLAGIPSVISVWSHQGATWGFLIIAMHVFSACFIALALPNLQLPERGKRTE